jgi:hypothetical protein
MGAERTRLLSGPMLSLGSDRRVISCLPIAEFRAGRSAGAIANGKPGQQEICIQKGV